MKIRILLVVLLMINGTILAQTTPKVKFNLTIADTTTGVRNLFFGLDPSATDGIDAQFGEQNLPPFPVIGAFEARFILPQNGFSGDLSSYGDIRQAALPFTGTIEYRIKQQIGAGSEVIFSWSLPSDVTGRLQDVFLGTLIDIPMSGVGSYALTEHQVHEQLKMLITYNNISMDADEPGQIPEYSLSQNYPNPFNPTTTLSFRLKQPGFTSLKLYSSTGDEVMTVVNQFLPAGNHQYKLNAGNLTSGVYFYRLTSNDFSSTQKMMILK